ncbi:preprotein translocase subunit SCY2, chloroplastic [Amborella trichopoda]|uniref:preprotein translocase subunit SCY2, chloroplastic n=1 Tax=Amborella trichopoda TaxID=13333 RepID=UPI0005D41975|nr:preprotein translocase subunit SCY2, chloroplastic [Amborella trichopoda]XP_011625807.1 preprotein translocase subunit SCY2, chloroplastic [Amborella trichopoda]|eukprot:XP_011625806.1 preprotein translocase subunit SCY2, chloroplastic [Amborella trichopoda]
MDAAALGALHYQPWSLLPSSSMSRKLSLNPTFASFPLKNPCGWAFHFSCSSHCGASTWVHPCDYPSAYSRKSFLLMERRHFSFNIDKRFPVLCSNGYQNGSLEDGSTQCQSSLSSVMLEDGDNVLHSVDDSALNSHSSKPMKFKNRYLNMVRLGSLFSDAAESFFKSEIRRRLFVTAMLILVSRIGYFIPLPGFDRRLMPEDYLNFTSGSVDELGDFTAELKLSLFQLGIGPQIAASILMQVLCHLLPSLVKLRKEGLDGHEKIKGYIWWISLGFAVLEGVIISCYSLPYSIYAATHRLRHVIISTCLLVFGAMSMTGICDKITESGFGQGSSLIICVSILIGYTETLYKMLAQFSGSIFNWWPYVLGLLGVFTIVTMWAVLVTEGCRKIKLQYYAFKLASSTRDDSPITEVEPYIPFNINPAGMQPVLTTTYLLAFPSIIASVLGSQFLVRVRDILNPEASKPWIFYSLYAFLVFMFNIFDIANLPKEISDYLNKMGARIPNIKPGKATVDYLTKIQASTRFWGGLLLSILATSSTFVDHYLRRINEGFGIGFTSVLIIVGSIIELRRSYQAYNVMPSLSKVLRRYGV